MEKRKPIARKVREGSVIANKMEKTLTVRVDRRISHPHLQKKIIRGKKYYVHCENADVKLGDKVRIVETKPLSKLKRWRLLEVIS